MNELYHHGIKGQKWGVRRYQNADGTLTEAGKRRISKINDKLNKNYSKFESSELESQKLNSKFNDNINNSFKSDFYLKRMSYYDDKSQLYRDSSKRLIKRVSKIDPKLGKKLSNKYADLLDKTFIGDFTLSELKKMQKDPDHLDEKAKKFVDQQMSKQLAIAKSKTEYNQHMQHLVHMQMQAQINQQIQMQIHQQIQMQIHQQMMSQTHMYW